MVEAQCDLASGEIEFLRLEMFANEEDMKAIQARVKELENQSSTLRHP